MCEKNLGPVPAGEYNITYCKDTMHGKKGKMREYKLKFLLVNSTMPCAFYLNPLDESQMCGRDDIFIHGRRQDLKKNLILKRMRSLYRERLNNSSI